MPEGDTASDTPLITVVGLGPGDPRYLTLAARAALDEAERVYVRTADHPAVAAIAGGVTLRACDDLYERLDRFEAVYEAIAARLVAAAEEGPVVYAVPGDPAVGETSVRHLRRAAEAAGVALRVHPGVSFLGPTLAALGWDALDGLQVADATALAARHHPDLDPDRPALLAQIYGRLLASDVKLVLLSQYPEGHPVRLVSGAGSPAARVETMPLAELDHEERFDDLSTLAIPPLPRPGSLLSLAEVVAHLRAPEGCPWDREQTHLSLRPYLIEEAYETLDALDAEDPAALAEELGDLLLQIALHAQIAVEAGDFGLPDVIGSITEKLVRRHPHVFGEVEAESADEVVANWEALKAEERRARGVRPDPLAGVPRALPALSRAQAVQHKARRVLPAYDLPADDAPARARAADAVREELAAVEQAAEGAAAEAAVGALLWAAVALARAGGVDAETALRDATAAREGEVRAALDRAADGGASGARGADEPTEPGLPPGGTT